jgi:2,3-bisphosphoglycerate-independent phosphoglycerate mutase
MGNSEVGHLNIGAGRVVEQWLLRISRAFKNNKVASTPVYQQWLRSLPAGGRVHVLGLYSDGGVHSHREHFHLLLDRLHSDFPGEIAVHLITDGRDVGPRTSLDQIREFEKLIESYPRASIASVSGRFYAMDRDKRWERTQAAYDAICLGKGHSAKSASQWVADSYAKDVTDEFIEPAVVRSLPWTSSDGVLAWNFREDRMRQIMKALCVEQFEGFTRLGPVPKPSQVLGFTDYDHSFHLPFLFEQLDIKNHLGEVVAAAGLRQLRVAETEKYPHVTYFFNGGIEKPYAGEERAVLPSPRDVKTYDLKPQMSAEEVTVKVVEALHSRVYDFIVVNLANCDMVGHTGVLEAAIKAVEVVDGCVGRMVQALHAVGGQGIIIADHGNAEQMVNYEDGTPHTAHTTFPVPCILLGHGPSVSLRSGGALCDVAPTLLKLMEIEQPAEMSGRSLIGA